jgi:adenosine deaminase
MDYKWTMLMACLCRLWTAVWPGLSSAASHAMKIFQYCPYFLNSLCIIVNNTERYWCDDIAMTLKCIKYIYHGKCTDGDSLYSQNKCAAGTWIKYPWNLFIYHIPATNIMGSLTFKVCEHCSESLHYIKTRNFMMRCLRRLCHGVIWL